MKIPPHLRRRPFRLDEGRDAGLSPKALRGSRFKRLFREVYACADVPLDERAWIAAARLTLPSDAVSIATTGLRDLGVSMGPLLPLNFVSTRPTERRDDRVKVKRVEALPCNDGRTAAPPSCMIAAGRTLTLVDWVAAADWLVNKGLVSVDTLAAEVLTSREWGSSLARAGIDLVRPGSESVRETRVRMMLTLSGLPEPQCNAGIHSGDRLIARGDLVLREWKVIVEYDGRQHVTDIAQWERDVLRLEQLADAGWHVIRVTNEHLKDSRALVQRVYCALAQRGYAGKPPTFDALWRACFA